MVVGDIKKINLSVSSFERMITNGCLYVDKTRMIERFIDEGSDVQLVTRQRRLGKSLNMDMLYCFLTDKADYRHLFKGLYIETSPAWSKVNSAPVFYFDFKQLLADDYKKNIYNMICDYIDSYCSDTALSRAAKAYLEESDYFGANGFLYLTESVYRATGKRSYILIDEYDKLLMDNYNTDKYDEIREFKTALLSAGLKGNRYLEKALLTGVMRISHESMMSGLNNLVTFDVFNDGIYTDDYGLTEGEIAELGRLADFDTDELRSWYNGVKINGHAIYNTYAVMSFLRSGKYDCYWGKSGTMDMITNLLNDGRKLTIAKLLSGEQAETMVDERISLKRLSEGGCDEAFYSLLVQAGYLALDEKLPDRRGAMLTIPNKELLIVWKDFILRTLYSSTADIKTLFDNADSPEKFSRDVEYFLSDRLSYHDLAASKGESKLKAHERLYHVFMLGILSAYNDVRCKRPLSNRESGDGRYDIFVEKPDCNFIFEFKACKPKENISAKATEALTQIDVKRYGADLDSGKRLVKTGIAFRGKQCRVKSS